MTGREPLAVRSESAARRRWVRAASVAALMLAVVSVVASAARANSYDVYACYAGQGTYLNPGASAASWTLADNNGAAYYLPYNQCGGSTNGFGVISHSGYIAPSGDFGEVYFKAPGGLTIRRVQLWRSLFDYGVGSGGASQRNYAQNLADGQLPSVGDEFDGSADVPHGAAGSGSTTDNGIVAGNYLSINLAAALPHEYAYVIGCSFANGCTTGGHNPASPNGPDTILNIFGAIVTVEDDVAPTLSLANTGLLAAGAQRGTVPLTLNASAIAGIARLELYVGAGTTPAASEDFTRTPNCQFWQAVPCQNLAGYQYPVDTTRLPNGTYYITVKAYDPAGNVAAVSSPVPVTIDNGPPPTPNGQPCPGEAIHVKIGGRRPPVTIGHGKRARLTGMLQCDGKAMARAHVRIAGGGISATVTTRANGSFAYTIPAGHNRVLRISYTAYSTDRRPAATARARVAVRAAITLRIAPRSTQNGGTVDWQGRIRGGPYPRGGIPLQIQVREGPRWQTFDEITVTRGRIAYAYTFRRTNRPTTYRFRVALPAGGAVGYPYAFAASNAVNVHVA